MAAPTFRSYSVAGSGGGTGSLTLSPPTGSVSGDVLVATISFNATTAPTAPGGWTLLGSRADAGTISAVTYGRVYNPGDTTYVFAAGSSGYMCGGISCISGADTTIANWQVGSSHTRASTGTSTTNVASSMTASFAGGLAVTWSVERTSATGDTVSVTNATKQFGAFHVAGTGIEAVAHSTVEYSTTAVPTVTFTYNNAQASNGIAGHIIIPASATPPPDTFQVQVSDGDDTFTDGGLWICDGADDLEAVDNVLMLPGEHQDFTVADMLAEDEFFWAHRGGSSNWLEFSGQAYTNAVWHGAKCLEVSVHQSSDGVWVMHHDTTTGRMCGTNLTIVSSTWASLSALTQTGNGYSGPIERLSDYFALGYHLNLVTVIENKTYADGVEYLDLIEAAFPGGRAEAIQHVIIKSSIGGGVTHLQEPYDRGYTQWGYMYDAVGFSNTSDVRVQILGLNADASGTDWSNMIAVGKPVVGHVLTTGAEVITCRGHGAVGFQCGNVITLIPRINRLP